MTIDNTALTEPPAGYDSTHVVPLQLFGGALMKIQVLAEVGTRLKHDRPVVHNNDVIRP